ncbi:hypothetical protein PTKIN_Ptkin08bG0129100 [Pterospermum kingtungense]
MEKKKHQKIPSASSQEPNSNDLLSKEDHNQSNEAVVLAKNTKTGIPLQENLSSLNEQCSHIHQWPYSNQQAAEPSSLYPRPCAPSPSLLPIPRWQQVAPLQPNSPNHPVQQGQPAVNLAQSTTPFWPSQRPSYHYPGISVPATLQPFISIATVDASWQPSAIIGRTTPRSQDQVPNLCYHFGPYPGFPGPWNPSSWWAHGQQSQPPFSYTFPEAYGYFSSAPPPMPNCSASFEESSQRGIIRPTAKLSQKHQQLWEAQSAENVQLWSVIGKLQSEIDDYKSRLTKLEAEVLSLKPTADESTARVSRNGLSGGGGAAKRGRPKAKRSVASVDLSASPDDAHPQARGKKPAASKVQPEATRVLVFEKVALNNLEDKQKTAQSNSNTQKVNGENVPFVITNSSVNLEVNGSNVSVPAFHNQVQQEAPGSQICGIDNSSSFEMKSNGDKVDNSKAALSVLSQQAKENKGVSVTHMGGTINGKSLSWPASVHPEEPERNMYNAIPQSFYDNSCVIREAGKLIPGWSFVNEEDGSDEVEDAAVAKDENEEEMGDDVSSEAEEMAQTKDESAYKMDHAVGTNPKDVPQYNDW